MSESYGPKGNGKDKAVQSVHFAEAEPPSHLRGIVHRFIELKTDAALPEDYRFHALPDACAYMVFDQSDPLVTGVTKLRATSQEMNLGRTFHFVNIRLLPGVLHLPDADAAYGQVDNRYQGTLPLVATNHDLIGRDFDAQQVILSALVDQLITNGYIVPNVVTQKIFSHLDNINSVADMATITDMSPRQLQRTLKQTTGFAPHDFLKVLRLQQALTHGPSDNYADQSHFIHSFRKATGYTPAKYARKFDV